MSMYELYSSKHKYCTFARQMNVTLVKPTVATFASRTTVSEPKPFDKCHSFHSALEKLPKQLRCFSSFLWLC